MTKQARFSIIPGWIVTDRRMKPRDLQVLCLLGRHTDKHGWCRRSQVKMAGELDCARSTVQAAIDRLADIGVVEKHVEDTKSGADSAHFYRVVFDRPPPSGYAFDAWEGDEDEDDNPMTGDNDGAPPAGISAPPADPEPAPPADSGPAPINDPCLTTPLERSARERGREDRKAIERRYWALVKNWKGFDGMPKDTGLPFFLAMAEDKRTKAERRFPGWCERLKAQRKDHWPSPSSYFGKELFEDIPDPDEPAVPPEIVAAFGKGGMGYRFWIMNQPERQHPMPSPFVQGRLDAGGDIAEDEIIARRAVHSWPRLAELNRRISEREQIRVAADIAAFGADFISTDLAGPVGQAWKRFFRKCRLPWLPVEPQYAYLPPVGDGEDLDRAVAAAWWQFAERCKGHADAA